MVASTVVNYRFRTEGDTDKFVVVSIRNGDIDLGRDFRKVVIGPALGTVVVPQCQKAPCGSIVLGNQHAKAVVVQARRSRMVVNQAQIEVELIAFA